MSIKPIRKVSIPEKVLYEIKSLIDSGQIAPGSRLPVERELAQMMNISRPSLREALKALSLLGVIENRPGSGTYLSSSASRIPIEPLSILLLFKKRTLFEIFEARRILEAGVAAIAARQRSDEDLQLMEEALNSMRLNLEKPEKYKKYELKFHLAIIESAGNLVIADLMEKLYKLLKDTKNWIYSHTSEIKNYRNQDYKNHKRIFNAIKSRNESMASNAMFDHLHDFEKLLKDQNANTKRRSS